jgi:hypothetical protein
MNKTITALLALVVLGGIVITAQVTGLISLEMNGKKPSYQNKGKLDVICELEVSKPHDNLSQPFDTARLTMPAQFDFDENTGWYTGEYAISMNRKGTLNVQDDLLKVSRPALFKRYGLMITGEHFTLNRRNGQFKQWLDLEGDKRLDLITGRCKRATNAPF